MKRRLLEALLLPVLHLLQHIEKRPWPLAQLQPAAIRTILVVSSTAIGDTLLSTPGIRAVRRCYPGARIIGLLNVQNRQLFENNPDLDGIVSYYGGYHRFWRTVRKLRTFHFDLALIFHGNEPQATPLCFLSGARFIVKVPNASAYRFLLSNTEPTLTWSDFVHGIEQRLKVAELAGCPATDRRMVLPLDKDETGAVSALLGQYGINASQTLIGFQVAASTCSRMWFPDKFVDLGRRIVADFPDSRIVITGSPGESAYADEIARAIGPAAIVAAGKLKLNLVPVLVSRLRLLVTGDTGIMHLAIAVGTPVVALFGAVDARRSGPCYDVEKHAVIQKFRTCTPCVGKRCTFQICMDNISVDDVFPAVARALLDQPNSLVDVSRPEPQ